MEAREQNPLRMTEEEYLAFDLASEYKNEYADGYVIEMAGASRKHNVVTSNVTTELSIQLRESPCEVYPGDMRVRVRQKTNSYRYPDVVVMCGTPQFVDDMNPETLMNPTVLFEVLSASTASVDAIKKSGEYRGITSVQDYVIVAQTEVRVIHLHKQSPTTWLDTLYMTLEDELDLTSINCTLKLRNIYRRIQFDSEDA